jgi:hypothetical protein
MRYMLLIHSDPADCHERSPEAEAELMAAYGAFNQELEAAGANLGADRLHPVSTATTVRVRDGGALITDGPFAESKEHLGGYYIIEAPDLDAAVAWAAKVPSATFGSVEVRPIWDMSAP